MEYVIWYVVEDLPDGSVRSLLRDAAGFPQRLRDRIVAECICRGWQTNGRDCRVVSVDERFEELSVI